MPYGSNILQANATWPRKLLGRVCDRFLACGAFCIAISFVHAQSSVVPGIRIDTYSPSDNRWSVTFTVLPSALPQPYSTINGGDVEAMQQIDASYAAVLDKGSMLRDKQGEFQFVLYLNRASDFQQEVYAYKVIENSYGSFNDLQGAINVRLASTGAVLGTVTVPLHCSDGPPNALVPFGGSVPSTAPDQKINMGSEADFSITLSNHMSLGAALGTPSAEVSCGGCLRQPISVALSRASLAPGDEAEVEFKLNPNLARAMHAAGSPNYLTLTVPVTAAQGGAQRGQQITIPIHFSLPRTLLALCIVFGTLVGGAIRAFMKFCQIKQWPWNEFLLGLIYGGLTWSLAYALFSGTGAQIQLAGVHLDPTQLFQAGLLCVLAAAGPPVLKQLDNSALKGLAGGK